MLAWILGMVVIIPSLGYGLLVMTANMMSDNPTEQTPAWPAGVGLIFGVAIIVGHHYGAW